MIREILINPLAALAKYAVPIRSQPGEIAFEHLIRVFRAYKLNHSRAKLLSISLIIGHIRARV